MPNLLNKCIEGNCLIFFKELIVKLPSLVNRYEDNKDLKKVLPLFGYDANQIIILKL